LSFILVLFRFRRLNADAPPIRRGLIPGFPRTIGYGRFQPGFMNYAKDEFWKRYQTHDREYLSLGLVLDLGRMHFPDDFFASMEPHISKGFANMAMYFLDDADRCGVDNMLSQIGGRLDQILSTLVSESGGTTETRNAVLEAETADKEAHLNSTQPVVVASSQNSAFIGNDKENKNAVLLPHRHRLELFSKCFQQLVIGSLGNELDLNGKPASPTTALRTRILEYKSNNTNDSFAAVQISERTGGQEEVQAAFKIWAHPAVNPDLRIAQSAFDSAVLTRDLALTA
jgi:hypothetical protein